MAEHFAGGCACKAIRYEFRADPVVMLDCQCRQCQRVTGGGHASYLTFATAHRTIGGEPRFFELVGDGGTVKHCAFCPTCGSPVYIAFPAMPDIFAVHAASLDDPRCHRPAFVTWHASAQPWDHLDPAIPTFGGMPPG